MDEEKKKRKKKPMDSGDNGHKKPWQETYATPEEIKAMLSERVILRYNEVRGRTEIHRLSQGLTIGENDQGLLTIFGGEGGVTDGYTDLDDREENTLWDELCAVKPVIKQHLQNIINSNYVPAYHPFRYYLEHLPPWTPEQKAALRWLLTMLHNAYPRALIVGHHDLNPAKDCPCIPDVANEYADLQP